MDWHMSKPDWSDYGKALRAVLIPLLTFLLPWSLGTMDTSRILNPSTNQVTLNNFSVWPGIAKCSYIRAFCYTWSHGVIYRVSHILIPSDSGWRGEHAGNCLMNHIVRAWLIEAVVHQQGRKWKWCWSYEERYCEALISRLLDFWTCKTPRR